MAFFVQIKAGQKAGFRVMLKYLETKKAFRYYIKQIDYYILISHIMKVLMLVTIFYVLPLIIPFPLTHSVTSFA